MRASKAAIIPFLTSLSLTTAQSTLVYNNSQLNVQSNNQYSGASLSGYHVGAGTSYMVAGAPGSGFSFSFNLSASAYQLLNNDIVAGYQLPCYIINEGLISNNSGPLECGVSVQDDDYFVASVTPPTAQTPGVVTFSSITGWYVCAVQTFTYGWIQRTIVGSFGSGSPSGDGVQNCTVISGLAFAMTSSTSTTTSTAMIYTNTTTTKPTSITNPATNTTLTLTSTIISNTTSTTQSTSGSISTWSPSSNSTFPTTRTVTLPQSSPSVQSSFQVSPFPPTSKLSTHPSTSNPATPTVSIVTPPAVPNQPPYSAPAQTPSAISDLTPPAVPNQPSIPAPSQAPSSAPNVPGSSAPNQPPSSESPPVSTTLLSVEPTSMPFPTSETSIIASSMVTMTRLCSANCTGPSSSMGPRSSSTVASSSGPYIPSLSYTSFVPVATWEGGASSVPATSKIALVFAIAVLLL